MSLTIRNNTFERGFPPKGKHIASCFLLVDLGVQKNKKDGAYSQKVLIGWELANALMQDGKPFTFVQSYTATLNKKSKLKALLESWRGKTFDLKELEGFQLISMLEEPCYLTIDHALNTRTQKYMARIFDICPLADHDTPCPPLQNTPILFDLDYYTEADYLTVPENIRNKINLRVNK